jgi:transcriptional regulator with XRE-family HTH domain
VNRQQDRARRREKLQQEIGDKVRALSEARNLTQQELADKMHRPRQFLTRLESGRDAKVTLDVVEEICDALEVSAPELLATFLHRSATKRGIALLTPNSDPRTARGRAASYRLRMAAARLQDAEIEVLADLAEARAEVEANVPAVV